MGRKGIGFWTAVGFLGALLAVTVSAGLGIRTVLAQRWVAAELRAQMESMEEATIEKQLKIAKWYNWSLEQGNFVPERVYRSILDLGAGRMGLLQVPELGLSLPITHGTGGPAGHDPATALPTGGREEQTVLYIDKDLPWREGMAVQTVLPGTGESWQVESIQVMSAGWPVDHPAGSALLTLVHDQGSTRTIVRCRPWEGVPWERQDGPSVAGRALFWGISPLWMVSALCAMEKILRFMHPGRRNKAIISR